MAYGPGKQGSQNSGNRTNNHLEEHMPIPIKVRIYKACVRPVMTYTAETQADTAVTKRMARSNEMGILRMIKRNTLWDQRRGDEISEKCKTEDVVG